MRLGFYAIILTLSAADVAAWVLAAVWLRRHAARRWLHVVAQVFFGVQTLYAAAMLVLVTLSIPGGRNYMDWLPRSLQALIYVWHMVFLPLTIVTWFAIGVFLAVRRALASLSRRASCEPEPPTSADEDALVTQAQPVEQGGVSRRAVLVASVAAIPPLLSVAATGHGLVRLSTFNTRKLTLPIPGLPSALEGMRIAHVSDLHVGRWSTDAFLDSVVNATNALHADLILFTGDLLDIASDDLPDAIGTLLRMRSRKGLYLVEGNHDLIDNGRRFREEVVRSGLNLLRGTSAFVEYNGVPVQLLGIPWSRGEVAMRADVQHVAALRQPGAFPILLAHHPHAFDAAAEASLPLTLSGHTHGGQIAITRELNAGNLMFRYISGVYEQNGCKLLVSNGTGNWFPLRLGAPAEIIDLTLARA